MDRITRPQAGPGMELSAQLPPILLTGVRLQVSDLQASLAFYVQTLGLPLGVRRAQYAEVEAPCLNIELHGGPAPGPDAAAGRALARLSIGFRVEDLDAALRHFDGRGIIYRLEEDEESRRAHFDDPDGRPLYLIERKY